MSFAMTSLGRPCPGPCPIVDGLITEPCPRRLIRSLDTSYLASNSKSIFPRARCVRCFKIWEIITRISKSDVPVSNTFGVCPEQDCGRASWQYCVYRVEHTRQRFGTNISAVSVLNFNAELLWMVFSHSPPKMWKCPLSYIPLLALLRDLEDPNWRNTNGYRPRVLVLDTEFRHRTSPDPLIPYQISIWGLITNTRVINMALVKDRSAIGDDQENCQTVQYDEVGHHIKKHINAEDFVIEWSIRKPGTFGLDLSVVRNVLDLYGFWDVILPPATNPFPLIGAFRQNLHPSISLHLPAVFGLVFPDVLLNGHFHGADIDVQATIYMVKLWLELLKHPADRSQEAPGLRTLQDVANGRSSLPQTGLFGYPCASKNKRSKLES